MRDVTGSLPFTHSVIFQIFLNFAKESGDIEDECLSHLPHPVYIRPSLVSYINPFLRFSIEQTWLPVFTCQNNASGLSWMSSNLSSVQANKLAVSSKDKVKCCRSESQLVGLHTLNLLT